MKNPWPRKRAIGSTSRTSVTNTFVTSSGAVSTPVANAHREGEVTETVDIVTPGFRVRSAKGEVINNPYSHISQLFTGGGMGNATTYPSTPHATLQDWVSSMRQFNTRFIHNEFRDISGDLACPALKNVDVDALMTLAKTKALGNVGAPTASGLVILGEGHKTLATLRNPLQATLQYLSKRHKRFSKLGSRYRVSNKTGKQIANDNKAIASAASSQYLTWYYGLLPFIRDCEQVLDAFTRITLLTDRETGRGSANDSYTIVDTELFGGGSKYLNQFTYEETVVVRSGILYTLEQSASRAYGTRISDIPEALWEFLPYSFVVDSFVNIQQYLAAIAVVPNVKYLATWDVLRVTITDRAETLSSSVTGPTVQTRSGSEWVERVIQTTRRTPSTPRSGIGLAFKPIRFSATKQLAFASLIVQQLTKGT